MPDADTDTVAEEYLRAAELAKLLPVSVHAIARWGKCGAVRVLEKAHGPRDSLANRYSVADVRRLLAMPTAERNALLKDRESRVERVENEKRASGSRGVRCCSLCGRDTKRRSGVCSRCD